ncbi:hypothetical protein SOVF_104510 [Spinacia oleracea]|nr:hypothetical protein SOVF_104510 [Spinacia oleracea]
MFLTCFTTFKQSFSDELAIGLFSSMVIDLQQLQKSLEENPFSLRWCSEAVSVVKKTHSHFLDFESSWEAVHMIDEYMSATLDLLDLCNLIKSAISGLDKYRMMIHFTVTRLNDVAFSSSRSKVELERVERENYNEFFDVKKLRELKLNKEGVMTNTNMQVMQGIRSTMYVISLFIFCSILHPIQVTADEGFYVRFCNSGSSPDCIRKLVACFNEKYQNAQQFKRPVLHENEMVEDAFDEFKGIIVSTREAGVDAGKLAKSLETLKDKSLVLKEGLDLLEYEVDELFENVIEGRKRVINLLTIY